MTHKTIITLYGNVGANPEVRVLPSGPVQREVYDALSDAVVVREYTLDERQLRTFSITVSGRTEDGETVTRWIRCNDWDGLSVRVTKGDRVKLSGHFRENRYEKDGAMKTVRVFEITRLKIERYARTTTEVRSEAE
jgi:single-stranded DNA-binding protein